jgi:rhamnose utilization protein RhaD (predicted bifunctional aldolase and dehydrogenase)
MIDEPSLNQLLRYSTRWGADFNLVQGAGGNTSIKYADRLIVKASGTRLEDALTKNIFVDVSMADGLAMADGGPTPAVDGVRASIETSLHAVIPHRVVAHLHALDILALGVRVDGEAILEERLAGIRWAWVDYTKPGVGLAQSVKAALDSRPADVIVLGNHGIVVAGESPEAVDGLLSKVLQRVAVTPRLAQPRFDSLAELARQHDLEVARLPLAHQAALDPVNMKISTTGSLYPDHVVFLGRGAMALDQRLSANNQSMLYLAAGVGALLAPGLPAEAHEMAACLGAVSSRVQAGARLRVLSTEEEDELLQWDAEKYRQQLAKRSSTPAIQR